MEEGLYKLLLARLPEKEEARRLRGYKFEVITSDEDGAGTDANVCCMITGSRGSSGFLWLEKSNHRDKFEDGQTDLFQFELADMGNLQTLRVSHDGTGAGAGWLLDRVVVREDDGDEGMWVFHCNRWLDEEKGDGQLEVDNNN